MKKKAQVSIEFALAISFLVFIFVVAEVFILQRAYVKGKEGLIFMYNDYTETLSREFLLANTIPEYFERKVFVLQDLQGADFNLTLYVFDNHTEVVLTPKRGYFGEFVYAVPFHIEGEICPGYRNILLRNESGEICINHCGDDSDFNCADLTEE
jgi:hypothetical protein